jgi:hypothetical protein
MVVQENKTAAMAKGEATDLKDLSEVSSKQTDRH